MSLHKLTAGDGYTYLTRQVAAQDATSRGYDGLGEYYAQKGESPGRWMGRGVGSLPEFLDVDAVTEAQMRALFGEGRHPDAERIEQQMLAAGHGTPAILAATRLGSPFRRYEGVNEFRAACAARFEAWNAAAGLPRDWPVPPEDRARIRTDVATGMFTAEFGRPPADARELSGFVARASRQGTTAVAGYDLTFSPVKSVSTLWAIANRQVAEQIEKAHAAAVADTLRWIEDNAAYTRTGRNGVKQVEVNGLIAAAFTHRDSRAGDPDLHTHVAISNKVQTLEGRWLALDGRPLHKMAVAASERYNTRLEAQLTDALGVRFAERASSEPGKRPVREIVGVDEQLAARWSARRHSINDRRVELAAKFQAEHGRTPNVVEALRLAQQATLETRQAKHQPRSYAEQRAEWRSEARAVLGGDRAVTAMVRGALHGRGANRSGDVTADWVAETADEVISSVAESRAAWQETHLRAEAERRARKADIPLAHLDAAVDRVVAAALTPAMSTPLGVTEPVSEPALLRRSDGTSVYTAAGTQLYTSARIMAAERRLTAAAQQHGGRVPSRATVQLALVESAANGVELNEGQAQLVRELALSGRRLQLALAPAGTGKTSAMRVLSRAWTDAGGDVIGLAPSATAAAVLRDETGARTDTVAKLTYSLDTGYIPKWVKQIGPKTLVIVDEAGMAGTAALAQTVDYVISKGGSVRLIGDDQQLAAVAAGGVLRDIAETAGAVTLSQVVRFRDPAEGAATLSVRAGDPAALGFYIDNDRVHVGDEGTVPDQAYNAWAAHRTAGRDAVMLAPTRELAAALNARARADRLAAGDTTLRGARQVTLADGNDASPGETIISRCNDRKLAITTTDWVKNGDRWIVNRVRRDGGLDVTHIGTKRRVTLPGKYVARHVELGYASTIHGAQGVTADDCHTVLTGAEARQLLYVALTRGRHSNHVYLAAAGDGDPHSVITRDALLPPTPVDILTRVLARDGAQTSATTTQRALADPAHRLRDAADRYADALATAAMDNLGDDRVQLIDRAAEAAHPGLTGQPAYPTLRAHLALLGVNGIDPQAALEAAITRRELQTAADAAAVLDWRLDPTGGHSGAPGGPLPWLPAVPPVLAADPQWGSYLTTRAAHVAELAEQVARRARAWTPQSAPLWARPLLDRDAHLVGDLAVWRAAIDVADTDRRLTGPPQPRAAEARAQRDLNGRTRRSLGDAEAASQQHAADARAIDPRLLEDPFWPQLADRLAAASRAGIDIRAAAISAAADHPLPDEYPAAALWWRLSRHLAPAALDATANPATSSLRPDWTPLLAATVGAGAAERVLADPTWPALVAAVSDAGHAGWEPQQVLSTAYELIAAGQGDEPVRSGELATALTWRVAMLANVDTHTPAYLAALSRSRSADLAQDIEPPDDDGHEEDAAGPLTAADEQWLANLHRDVTETAPQPQTAPPEPPPQRTPAAPVPASHAPANPPRGAPRADTDDGEPADAAGSRRARIIELNKQALAYFTRQYPGSWAADHLTARLGTDLTGDGRFSPGYAPAGWTSLTNHLRRAGATDREILAAGLGTRTRDGRIIDRFRDRLLFPIYNGADIHGFIGRRNPATPDAGPKYLNSPDTELFHKGGQLFGLTEAADALRRGATPGLVEGPLDAIAITLADADMTVGLATLGTAFTDRQADQLLPYIRPGKPGTIVATDADAAGRKAAARAYWQLTARGDAPRRPAMPDGIDPAEMLERSGPAALSAALRDATPLAVALLDESIARYADRLDSCEGRALAATAAGEVIAALPIDQWQTHMAYATRAIGAAPGTVHAAVFEADQVWTADPCGVARHHHAEPPTNDRPAPRAPESGRPNGDRHGSAPPPPANADRAGWINLVRRIDPRLTDSPDWPGLANGLDRAHAAGYDVNANLPRLATRAPLPDHHPARALHYRLVQECEAAITPNSPDTQIATAEANSTASRARLTAEGRRSDNVAAARPQAARPPTAEPHPQPQSATEVRRPHDPSPTHPKRRR